MEADGAQRGGTLWCHGGLFCNKPSAQWCSAGWWSFNTRPVFFTMKSSKRSGQIFCFQRHRPHYCGSQTHLAKANCWKQKIDPSPSIQSLHLSLQSRLFLVFINKMLNCSFWSMILQSTDMLLSYVYVLYIYLNSPAGGVGRPVTRLQTINTLGHFSDHWDLM